MMGFQPGPGPDVYHLPLNLEVVPVGEMPADDDDDETDDDASEPLDPDVKKKR